MDVPEAIKLRNSVRNFTDEEIKSDVEDILRNTIDICNKECGLNLRLCLNEPKAFASKFFH